MEMIASSSGNVMINSKNVQWNKIDSHLLTPSHSLTRIAAELVRVQIPFATSGFSSATFNNQFPDLDIGGYKFPWWLLPMTGKERLV